MHVNSNSIVIFPRPELPHDPRMILEEVLEHRWPPLEQTAPGKGGETHKEPLLVHHDSRWSTGVHLTAPGHHRFIDEAPAVRAEHLPDLKAVSVVVDAVQRIQELRVGQTQKLRCHVGEEVKVPAVHLDHLVTLHCSVQQRNQDHLSPLRHAAVHVNDCEVCEEGELVEFGVQVSLDDVEGRGIREVGQVAVDGVGDHSQGRRVAARGVLFVSGQGKIGTSHLTQRAVVMMDLRFRMEPAQM